MKKTFDDLLNIDTEDLVGEFVRLKGYEKELKEKISAVQTLLLLNKEETQKDERVKVVVGKESYVLTETAYERLRLIGERVEVIEKRNKKFEEFDVDIQNELVKNDENYTTTKRADYILVAKKK